MAGQLPETIIGAEALLVLSFVASRLATARRAQLCLIETAVRREQLMREARQGARTRADGQTLCLPVDIGRLQCPAE